MASGRPTKSPSGKRIEYDRISLAFPKAEATLIRDRAKKAGLSVNRYLFDCAFLNVMFPKDVDVKRICEKAASFGVSVDKYILNVVLQAVDEG